MKYWFCEEMVIGEWYLVCAETWEQACDIAKEIGADLSCGCEREPEVYVHPKPLTENEVIIIGLDEY